MARSEKFVGLSPRAQAMLVAARVMKRTPWHGPFGNQYERALYRLAEGGRVEEVEQASPWSSGPYFFMTLVAQPSGLPVPGADWTAQEIANYIGEWYEDTPPQPSEVALQFFQDLLDRGSVVPGNLGGSQCKLRWSDEGMLIRALAAGQLRAPGGEWEAPSAAPARARGR